MKRMSAKAIRKLRERLGTRAQVAEQLGVSVKAVESWELGVRRISVPTQRLLLSIAEAKARE